MNSTAPPFLGETMEFKPSKIHGIGLFARQTILAGALVLEYLGEKISKAESVRRCQQSNSYIFALDDRHDIDGNVDWNPARFVNHSCRPNCDAECVDGRIWILAKREITAGEEVTFNYGYDLESYREHPCHCGFPECVGFIMAEEFFDGFRELHPSEPPTQN